MRRRREPERRTRTWVREHVACKQLVRFGVIDVKLPLTHHAVASKTQVLDERRAVGFAGEMFVQSGFGVELGEEHRITARQTHHRVAPLAEW